MKLSELGKCNPLVLNESPAASSNSIGGVESYTADLIMKESYYKRFAVAIILFAYLGTGNLSPMNLLGQSFYFKLDASRTIHNERSIDLDERPYWTSHKHITSSEQFSNDHVLSTAESWISPVVPKQTIEIPADFPPTPGHLLPQSPLRAPPLS